MTPWTKLAILWEAHMDDKRTNRLANFQTRLNIHQHDMAGKLKSMETRIQQLSESNQRLRQELRAFTRPALSTKAQKGGEPADGEEKK